MTIQMRIFQRKKTINLHVEKVAKEEKSDQKHFVPI